ncbi:hypothetical protein MBANPS3_012542 [Mucor bainieri]
MILACISHSKLCRYITFPISKILATYEALFKAKWAQEGKRTASDRNHKGYNFRNNEVGGKNKFKRRSTDDDQGGSKNPRLSCKYHPGLTNDSEADCILPTDVKKKSINKAYKKYGQEVKFSPNYKEGHNCKLKD